MPAKATKWGHAPTTLGAAGFIKPGAPGFDQPLVRGSRPLLASEWCAQPDPQYVWRTDMVRWMYGFWNAGHRAAMMIGPSGSGKTSQVEQWHAALGWPLLSCTGHKRFTIEEFFGQPVPTPNGGFAWQDGPYLIAARNGYSFNFNEINAAPPEVTIALNDLAQAGSAITIGFTGESLIPHPNFRIFATKNPEGTIYAGRQPMDTSTRHRFKNCTVGFPDEADEVQILLNHFEKHGVSQSVCNDVAVNMVKVARLVRARCMEVSSLPDAIPEVVSTRILKSWVEEMAVWRRMPGAIHMSMRTALTAGSDPVSAKAIHGVIETVFGVDDKGNASTKPTP